MALSPHPETGCRRIINRNYRPLAAAGARVGLRLDAAGHDAGCHRYRLALLAVLVFAKILALH